MIVPTLISRHFRITSIYCKIYERFESCFHSSLWYNVYRKKVRKVFKIIEVNELEFFEVDLTNGDCNIHSLENGNRKITLQGNTGMGIIGYHFLKNKITKALTISIDAPTEKKILLPINYLDKEDRKFLEIFIKTLDMES